MVEPTYFRSFKLPTVVVKVVPGRGGNNSLVFVQNAIHERSSREEKYDEYWLVFDKDGTPPDDFNRSIQLANQNNFFPAYSNQAFEYWFILHFQLWQGRLERSWYDEILTDLLGFDYEKTENGIRKVADRLYHLTEIAIRHAKHVNQSFEPHTSPADKESSTCVYHLIEQLMSY